MKRTCLVLTLILVIGLLCGCVETPPPETTAPPLSTETVAPAETTLPTETTAPVETTTPTAQDFSEYEALLSFSADPNWLARTVGCIFEKPEDIDLYYMFYLGVEHPGSWDDISEKSRQKLLDSGFTEEMDLQIMPAEKLEEALLSTFGIDLMSVEMPDEWAYIVTEDAFCSNHSDAYFPGIPEITAVEDDGTTIRIHYTIEGYYNPVTDEFLDNANLLLTLVRNEDSTIHAVSNLIE